MKKALNIAPGSAIVQLAKYGVVGVLVNGGGYGLFLALLYMNVEYKLAASISYIFGVLVSFLMNRRIVFESALPVKSGLLRLGVMLASGYILNIAILYIGVGRLEYRASLVQLVSIIFVSLFFYLVNKFYVHRNK